MECEEEIMRCGKCGKEIVAEYHCELYDTLPFFCSEKCYGERKK